MLSFKQLAEKKTKIKINPKQKDITEKRKHPDDCACVKCEDKEEVEKDVATNEAAVLGALAKGAAIAGKVAVGAAKAGAKAAKAAKPVLKKVGKVAAGAAEAGGNAAKAIGNLPKAPAVEPEEAPADPEHPELMHKGGKVKKVKAYEGTAYGIYRGDGKRKLPGDKKKEKKVEEATLATARKNIGRDPKKKSCWDGYEATGTKMKGGKSVPDCKKEELTYEMHVTASMGRHAKAWREKKAEEQRRKDNPAYYAEVDKIRAAKAKRKDKAAKNLASNMKKEEFELEEERSARKMNVRTKGTIKKQIAKDAEKEAKRQANKTGEYKEAPKKKRTLKKPSQLTKVVGGSKPKAKPKAKPVAAVKKVAPKPKAKKKEAPKTQKGAMAYDGPNKARSQAADRVKAKTKAKQKSLPKKETPKSTGKKTVGDRVRDVIKKGVKRHKKAVQPARVFAKGAAKGAKDTVKFAGKVKKVLTGEERKLLSYSELTELNRYGKETGKATGSMNKRAGTPVKKGGSEDKALNVVRGMIRKQTGRPEGQRKKVKGAKSDAGAGKYAAKAKEKAAYASRAKKAGFKSTQDYTNTVARYGGESNYKKGKGLGT